MKTLLLLLASFLVQNSAFSMDRTSPYTCTLTEAQGFFSSYYSLQPGKYLLGAEHTLQLENLSTDYLVDKLNNLSDISLNLDLESKIGIIFENPGIILFAGTSEQVFTEGTYIVDTFVTVTSNIVTWAPPMPKSVMLNLYKIIASPTGGIYRDGSVLYNCIAK